jgi:hypothetical protein
MPAELSMLQLYRQILKAARDFPSVGGLLIVAACGNCSVECMNITVGSTANHCS